MVTDGESEGDRGVIFKENERKITATSFAAAALHVAVAAVQCLCVCCG